MAISSLGDADSQTELSDRVLCQRLGLILSSPNTSLDPQPLLGHVSKPSDSISSLPVFPLAAVHSRFHNECFQQPQVTDEPQLPTLDSPGNLEFDGEEYEDLSPLEYARKNKLSRNHLEAPVFGPSIERLKKGGTELTDDSHLPQFELTANVNADERLTISKYAAKLIASVSCEESSDWVDNAMLQMIDTRKCKNLKVELPLLRSDHETDCKKFSRRDGFEIKLEDVVLPLEMVDEINNGGLGFSPIMWNREVEILEVLKKEKLEVTRDTMKYLTNTLKSDWTEEDERRIWHSVRIYKKVRCLYEALSVEIC